MIYVFLFHVNDFTQLHMLLYAAASFPLASVARMPVLDIALQPDPAVSTIVNIKHLLRAQQRVDEDMAKIRAQTQLEPGQSDILGPTAHEQAQDKFLEGLLRRAAKYKLQDDESGNDEAEDGDASDESTQTEEEDAATATDKDPAVVESSTSAANHPGNTTKAKQLKKKKRRRTVEVDYYDTDDSFIDDSEEAYEELGIMTKTNTNGYYIWYGPLETELREELIQEPVKSARTVSRKKSTAVAAAVPTATIVAAEDTANALNTAKRKSTVTDSAVNTLPDPKKPRTVEPAPVFTKNKSTTPVLEGTQPDSGADMPRASVSMVTSISDVPKESNEGDVFVVNRAVLESKIVTTWPEVQLSIQQKKLLESIRKTLEPSMLRMLYSENMS